MIAPEKQMAVTVKRFLLDADTHLQRGDIILSRSPTFNSHFIRFATNSQFSHAAMVFLTPKKEEGYNNTFVLESTSAGVGLSNLKDYVLGKTRSEVVVLRLQHRQADEAFFKSVRGLMLDHVKSGYDFGRAVRIALSVVFGLRLVGSRFIKGSHKSMRNAVAGTRRRMMRNWVPPQFICSGFIQYGLVEAARRADLDVDAVLLRDNLSSRDRDGILAVTPEDFAKSTKLTWLFAIRRGFAHRVENYDEALSKLF